MKDIEFVSYDGKYPNLCSGNLILNIDGTEYSFSHVLSSGGSCWFSNDYSDCGVNHGPWSMSAFEKEPGKFILEGYGDDSNKITFTEDEIEFITMLVNENVTHGCCGGCI